MSSRMITCKMCQEAVLPADWTKHKCRVSSTSAMANLFPAPKNTKPNRTRIRPYKERHTPDPNHHNYNREQNFNQKLSSTLAWLKLQCDGAASNLNSAGNVAFSRLAKKDLAKLQHTDKRFLEHILKTSNHIKDELKALSHLVEGVNRTKTKLTKEQMK